MKEHATPIALLLPHGGESPTEDQLLERTHDDKCILWSDSSSSIEVSVLSQTLTSYPNPATDLPSSIFFPTDLSCDGTQVRSAVKPRFRRASWPQYGTRGGPYDDRPVEENWTPEAKLNTEDDNSDFPSLLTQAQRQVLARNALPVSIKGRSWKRLYSLERDGDAFEMFLKKVQNDDFTLLVLKTTDGHVFGGFADRVWERQESYFGAGQAFLFSVNDDDAVSVYHWTGANRMVQHVGGDKRRFAMGGGGSGFGLCVEDNFRQGSTSNCETFENEALCPGDSFRVLSFEVYGFVRGSL